MRQIRFRAWDGKVMKEVSALYPLQAPTSSGKIACRVYDNVSDELLFADAIMQFTGLLDKNGKEIYEGDIVKCHTNNAFKYPHKGEVIYLEHIAGFGITTEPIVNDVGDEAPAFTYFNYNENFEVIGNIYENPDLLK